LNKLVAPFPAPSESSDLRAILRNLRGAGDMKNQSMGLMNTRFNSATLNGADLSGADISRADLSFATCQVHTWLAGEKAVRVFTISR
jgi:uncharacterized protein YjbI with pentapeptide repeats